MRKINNTLLVCELFTSTWSVRFNTPTAGRHRPLLLRKIEQNSGNPIRTFLCQLNMFPDEMRDLIDAGIEYKMHMFPFVFILRIKSFDFFSWAIMDVNKRKWTTFPKIKQTMICRHHHNHNDTVIRSKTPYLSGADLATSSCSYRYTREPATVMSDPLRDRYVSLRKTYQTASDKRWRTVAL